MNKEIFESYSDQQKYKRLQKIKRDIGVLCTDNIEVRTTLYLSLYENLKKELRSYTK